jgi:RNA polymerase sigma-70 factor, ECF subfamily
MGMTTAAAPICEESVRRANREGALMRGAAAGDQRAFAVLYEQHHRRLFRVAYGVVLDPEEAREIVQDAFVRLFEAAGRWEARASVGTWLHLVVVRRCLDVRRRIARATSKILTPRAPATPEAEALVGEAMRAVEQSLAAMPIKQRAVASLFLASDLKPTELAPLVDLTANAARVTLHRALARLRDDLSAKGIDARIEEGSWAETIGTEAEG